MKAMNCSNVILIDNYDSFTWNVYQYLVLEGATVSVYRNDEISLDTLIEKAPTQLVISPGPGHPNTDAGISNEAIKYFAGRIPVLGVCLGEQCIISVFGGQVEITGEILHGKTSQLYHDSEGIFAGVGQGIPVTRYHSLAGTHVNLPDCLLVTAWTESISSKTHSIIMGVRHKNYTVQGVQFHPESVLTAEGRTMLRNFLTLSGGTWDENSGLRNTQKASIPGLASNENANQKSILETIFARRKERVATQKNLPSNSLIDLQRAHALDLAPPQISFRTRLSRTNFPISLMAEIKRASPSKGKISSPEFSAPDQAISYALAGASVISVLTEPDWFQGSIEDLQRVRQSLNGLSDRPALLRKDFIFDEYQILEARLAGADSVLLIVKMLPPDLLKRLFAYSRSLGMEPLVEVNDEGETEVAVRLGSAVIGVNNRNLSTFDVDLSTTSRLKSLVPRGTLICALSGISGPADVAKYRNDGVDAILVGEALMRAPRVASYISDLFELSESDVKPWSDREILVKICGTRSVEGAKAAARAGADLVGIILVEGRRRSVSRNDAREIVQAVKSTAKREVKKGRLPDSENYDAPSCRETSTKTLSRPDRALAVGVFQDQPLEYVLLLQRELDLDVVQLHGSEPIEWASLIPVPVIRSFKPVEAGIFTRGYHTAPLIDAGSGGSGIRVDMHQLSELFSRNPNGKVILAGGLDPENVRGVLKDLGTHRGNIIGVDVSSGVEVDGQQSEEKIEAFVHAVKGKA